MSSFIWKRQWGLETQQGRETPQDLETRYEGADIEPASLAAWRLFVEQLISSADPAIAFIGFLLIMQALPERPLSQPRVFVSHRMADVPYASALLGWPGSNTGSTCTTPCCVLPPRPSGRPSRYLSSPRIRLVSEKIGEKRRRIPHVDLYTIFLSRRPTEFRYT
ncbi:MAG: hypothetical protein QOJ51_5144 [Acidobacteriaceae bacterium]|nr:hypothetical protein [Acidobacteriaceae bacterium]